MSTENNPKDSRQEDDFSDFFYLKSEGKIFPESGKIFPEVVENFSPVSNKEEERNNLKLNSEEDLHLKYLLHSDSEVDSDGPVSEGLDLEDSGKEIKGDSVKNTQEDIWDFDEKGTQEMSLKSNDSKTGVIPAAPPPAKAVSSTIGSEFLSEPLPGRVKGKKAVKTAQERRAEAVQLYNQGHLCNPVGKPNTRGRRLKPSLARPIGDIGSVTTAQLWAAYLKIFEEQFGDQEVLKSLIADTREAMEVFFSGLRQKFLDTTGRDITNRDLYEYIKWFHDPIRTRPMLVATKRSFIHPNQLGGQVYIQRFTNERLTNTTKSANNTFVSTRVEDEQKKTTFLSAAFEEMRACEGDNNELAKCIGRFGYVVFAEYLADLHGSNASQCKTKIIELMYSYIKTSSNKELAIKYMELAWERTLANADIECYIWPDWKETSKDLLKIVLEKLEKESPRDGNCEREEEIQ